MLRYSTIKVGSWDLQELISDQQELIWDQHELMSDDAGLRVHGKIASVHNHIDKYNEAFN